MTDKFTAYYILVIILPLLMLITSCETEESRSDLEHLTFENTENIPLEDIDFKSFKIISLETKDESLLGDVVEVRPYMSYFYVLDSEGKLFAFDSDGKYINHIGTKGNGPDEYLKLSAFFINKKDQCISIIDDVKNKIYNYDLKGDYLNAINTTPSIKYVNNSLMTTEGDILLNYYINFDDNAANSIIDGNNYKKIEYLNSYAPIEVRGYLYSFSAHPMSENADGEILFIMPLCDTIFTYSNKKYHPKYIVDIPDAMANKELFKTNITEKNKTFTSLIFKYGNDGFFTGFTGIFETHKHILLKYRHNGILSGFYLANKENFEGNYYVSSIPEYPIKIPMINIVGSTEQEFVGAYPAMDLITLYNDIDKNKIDEVFGQFKTVVESLDEESNPCLVLYSFG